MVEFEIFHTNGENFDCIVEIEGEHPETSEINLKDCDLEINYVEQLVDTFRRGQTVNLRLFDGKNRDNKRKRSNKIKSKGGNSYGSMSFRFNTIDNDAELIHLLVDDTMEGHGLGTVLFTIFMGLCEIENADSIRMNIGGGEDTAGWLESMGVPSEDIEMAGSNLARVYTNLGDIDYDTANLRVTKLEEGEGE